MRRFLLAGVLGLLASSAMAGPPVGPQPPATPPPVYAPGPPSAGSGTPGQIDYDTTAHATWLNVAGTWYQVGIFTAPTASPITPTTTHQYLLLTGGGYALLTGGGKIIIQ